MLEAALIVAMIAQRYQVRLLADRTVDLDWSITLRPKHGVWVTISDWSASGHVAHPTYAGSFSE